MGVNVQVPRRCHSAVLGSSVKQYVMRISRIHTVAMAVPIVVLEGRRLFFVQISLSTGYFQHNMIRQQRVNVSSSMADKNHSSVWNEANSAVRSAPFCSIRVKHHGKTNVTKNICKKQDMIVPAGPEIHSFTRGTRIRLTA